MEPYVALSLDPLADQLAEVICSPLLVMEGEKLTSRFSFQSKEVPLYGGASVQNLVDHMAAQDDTLDLVGTVGHETNATRKGVGSSPPRMPLVAAARRTGSRL